MQLGPANELRNNFVPRCYSHTLWKKINSIGCFASIDRIDIHIHFTSNGKVQISIALKAASFEVTNVDEYSRLLCCWQQMG